MYKLSSLRQCLDRHAKRMYDASWKTADASKLSSLINEAVIKIYSKPSSIDPIRAFIWLASAELSRRGIAPRYRRCLGVPKKKPTSLAQAAVKADAPFIDLLWIATRYPDHKFPPRMKLLAELNGQSGLDDLVSEFSGTDSKGFNLDAMGRAERLMAGKGGTGRKCRQMGFSKKQQFGMRYFLEESTQRKISSVELQSRDIEQCIRAQKIPQLNRPEMIESRLQYWKAWKLAGGGSHWQDAADILNFMTGKTVSRQAVRDLIGRMKLSRTVIRKRRKLVKKAVLSGPLL